MIRRKLQPLINSIREVVTNPRAATTRWQRTVRYAYDLGWSGARQLRDDDAPMMAAALTYRTLFALLPILVVATIVVQAIYGAEEFKSVVRNMVGTLGLDEVQVDDPDTVNGVSPGETLDESNGTILPIEPETAGSGAEGEAVEDDATVTLGDWIEDLVDQAMALNLEAMGWIGTAIVIYAAIALVVTIENIFNTIYRAPKGRAWTWRVPLYWFILTLSPVAIGVTYFLNTRLTEWIDTATNWEVLLHAGPIIWAFCVMWLFMVAVYILVPNTTVEIKPAIIGGLVAAVLIEIGRRTLGAYMANAFTVSQIYGSLGLIPVFMFWLYVMWLVVLFGLQVSAMVQMVRGRRMEVFDQQKSRADVTDPLSVLAVMLRITEEFEAGRPAHVSELARSTCLAEPAVRSIADNLVDAGYLHRIDRTGGMSLAKPPERIKAETIIRLGYDMSDCHTDHEPDVFRRLREAQCEEAGRRTLAELAAQVSDEQSPESDGKSFDGG